MSASIDRGQAATRPPTVSVVVPVYNVEQYVVEALHSVLAQTFQDFEIIAVDDGSTDGTRAAISRLQATMSPSGPELRLLHQSNRGASAARNLGARAANAGLITFLDGDDRLAPPLLEEAVRMLTASPDADLVFPRYRHVDAAGDPTGIVSRARQPHFDFCAVLVGNPIHSCSGVTIRRVALERANGFDEHLTANVDFDLWLRLSAPGHHNIAAMPEIRVDYRQRPDQLTASWRRMAENWNRVLEKCRRRHPETTAALESLARANHRLYLSAIARQQDDLRAAREMVAVAWQQAPMHMLRSLHAWTTAALAFTTWLPPQQRQRLDRWIRRRRLDKLN